MEKLDRLVELLERMRTEIPDDVLSKDDEDGLLYYPENYEFTGVNGYQEMYDEAESLCFEVIVSRGGWPLNKNRSELMSRGFSTYPGDHDSFGWITGCIQKDGRVLVFG